MTLDPGHAAGLGGQTALVDSGLTMALQTLLSQSQTTGNDVSALRADVAKALTHLEVIDQRNRQADDLHRDYEARLRVLEARPDLADMPTRVAALERFRYTVAGLAVAGGVVAGWVGQWVAVHVHG